MKRKLALFLCALMALMPMAALAEEDSEALYLRLSDPVIYNGEEVLADLTGLSAELGVVSDGSTYGGLYARLDAGKASLAAALAADTTEARAYMDGLTHLYTATAESLGLDAEMMESMGLDAEIMEILESLNLESYADRAAAVLDKLEPQLEELLANATPQTGVKWWMYDDEEHSTTHYSLTLPTRLLRQYVEEFYQLGLDLMTDVATAMRKAGLDVEDIQRVDLDQIFATNPVVVLDTYQAEDDPSQVSFALTLKNDRGMEYTAYVDVYASEDQTGVYVQAGDKEEDALEFLFILFDDGSVNTAFAVTQNGDMDVYFSFATGPDESGEFIIHELNLETEDANLYAYHHSDNATERYLQMTLDEGNTSIALEMATSPMANGLGEAGQLALRVKDRYSEVTVVCNVEYGVGGHAPNFATASSLPQVDMISMTNAQIGELSREAQNALMAFLTEAAEEIPALGELMNGMQ